MPVVETVTGALRRLVEADFKPRSDGAGSPHDRFLGAPCGVDTAAVEAAAAELAEVAAGRCRRAVPVKVFDGCAGRPASGALIARAGSERAMCVSRTSSEAIATPAGSAAGLQTKAFDVLVDDAPFVPTTAPPSLSLRPEPPLAFLTSSVVAKPRPGCGARGRPLSARPRSPQPLAGEDGRYRAREALKQRKEQRSQCHWRT